MAQSIQISEIKADEIATAANTLFQAFKNDPLILWIFGNQEDFQNCSLAAYKTWIKYTLLYGKAFKTNHFEAVALRRKPGDVKLTFWRVLRSGMIKLPSILGKDAFDRLMQFDALTTKEKQKHMGVKPFWYCWMLGTLPEKQNQGYGSALMKHTFAMAKRDNLPCYLETSSERSAAIHRQQGYQTLSEIILPNANFKVLCMLRNPQ